jgi:hypothetical protein
MRRARFGAVHTDDSLDRTAEIAILPNPTLRSKNSRRMHLRLQLTHFHYPNHVAGPGSPR